jgi:hypothetical protein
MTLRYLSWLKKSVSSAFIQETSACCKLSSFLICLQARCSFSGPKRRKSLCVRLGLLQVVQNLHSCNMLLPYFLKHPHTLYLKPTSGMSIMSVVDMTLPNPTWGNAARRKFQVQKILRYSLQSSMSKDHLVGLFHVCLPTCLSCIFMRLLNLHDLGSLFLWGYTTCITGGHCSYEGTQSSWLGSLFLWGINIHAQGSVFLWEFSSCMIGGYCSYRGTQLAWPGMTLQEWPSAQQWPWIATVTHMMWHKEHKDTFSALSYELFDGFKPP